MQYSHRRSLLQGLLKVVRPDGKIPAEANSCATPTARMKHQLSDEEKMKMADFDVVIRNGSLVDGTSSEPVDGDIAILDQ